MADSWVLYIVECRDGSLYTGITNDLPRRLAAHDAGTGARYTRGRGPVRLRYSEACGDRSAASRRERAVKRLDRAQKLLLIASMRRSRRKTTPVVVCCGTPDGASVSLVPRRPRKPQKSGASGTSRRK